MAIPMLEVKSVWAKLKSGWSGGTNFKTLAKQPGHTFVNGIDPGAAEAAQHNAPAMKSAFGGSKKSK